MIGRFAESYLRGETPNPCIDCNRYMKFEKLFERADILGCDCIATGHYARIGRGADGLYTLRRALDPSKDQSYVLYTMTQAQLARTLFPLGSLRKDEVREIAARSGLPTASKPDSQDICFAPDGDYARAVERYAGRRAGPGAFVSPDGGILGTHRGIIHYTVGQRRGLGLSFAERRYVCGIDPVRNTVTLGREEDLLCREVETGAFHWISGRAPDAPFACTARLRYRQPEQPVRVFPRPDGTALLRFDRPLRAAAPGQAAVLYQGDVVLGGGVIRRCGAPLC